MNNHLPDYTILVVENNRLNLELLLSILNRLDCRLMAAKSGRNAIRTCDSMTPDLILMDVHLPDMDGFETARLIRNNEKIQDVPILFTSTFSDSKNIIKCFDAGGVDYITKPFNEKELLARINVHLSLSKLREQLLTDRDNLNAILHNILPDKLINTLREGVFPKPESTENAAVLFTDFKNFSSLTHNLGSNKSVEHLNLIYFAFDEIVTRFGLERVKTIGDAYFAVGGINTQPDDLYLNPVLAALKMQEFTAYYNRLMKDIQWQLRIGFTVGPVTSGVIGYQKIAYDVWGDTVNLANRLEKEAEPGHVAVPEFVYRKIDKYLDITRNKVLLSSAWGTINIYQCSGTTDSLPVDQKNKFREPDPKTLLEQASSKKSLLGKIFKLSDGYSG